MPIYAYRCERCGHAKDVLQRISDPVLTVCPSCGEQAFRKQVTAAGFQLKGSGWYVTDFRGDKPSGKAGEAKGSDDEGSSVKSAENGTSPAGDKGSGAAATDSTAGSPAPAAAPTASKSDPVSTPAAAPPVKPG